ncbi:MAG: ROK family protein [Chloroflexi bacterium]|nr:ROK family protein [Chloroflexota bacterium]
MSSVIGVDIGGTQMRAARFNSGLEMIERASRPTLGEQGVDSIVARLIELIEQVAPEDPSELAGIGVGAPGPLDPDAGIIRTPPNIPFHHTPLVDILHDALHVPVLLDNDANLAALAEHRLGAGQGTQNMVYLTLSTGLGSGLILNGELYRGRGQAGEAGFTIIAADHPASGPEQHGYAEFVASGTAIARRATEAVQAGKQTTLAELDTITGEDVANAAEAGDPVAQTIIRETGRYAGILIASLSMLLQPDCFVLGGSVTQIGDRLFEPMHEALREFAIDPVFYEGIDIRQAALGDDVGLYGAAALALGYGG